MAYLMKYHYPPQQSSVAHVPGHRQQRILYFVGLVMTDAMLLAVAFTLVHWIRFHSGLEVFNEGTLSPAWYQMISLLCIGLWLTMFAMYRTYAWENLLGGTQEYALLLHACTLSTVLLMVTHFLWPFMLARGWLLLAWFFSFLLVAMGRFVLRRVIYALRNRGYYIVPALIVGNNDEAHALAEQLQSWRTSGLNVLGFVDNEPQKAKQSTQDLKVIGQLSALPELVRRYQVEELILTTSALSSQQILEIFRSYGAYGHVNVRLSSGLFDVITTGLQVKSLGCVPLITVNKIRLSLIEEFMKNCLDRFGAAFALLLLSPLFLAIALAVRLSSPGPVVYRRRVLGQGNTEFDAYKFRSMYVNGDELLSPEQRAYLNEHHKLKDKDPRITPIGHFLRRYSLDELPQLVNVLRGEMSLIGPRMITRGEQEKYGKWDMNLLTVKPGISGLWQVSGRSDLSYEARVQLDMQYIRNYTIWLDLHLCFQTIHAAIKGKGAY